LVPADKVYEMRMALAGKGLPQGGVGFEIFDKSNIGTTDFVQKMNYLRAIQGELARTISQIDGVEKSRVHISLPEDSVFLEDQKEATASVFMKLRPGLRLKSRQVEGIAYLISGSVEGLTPEYVTIMDTAGQLLNRPGQDEPGAGLTGTQMEVQQNMERGLEQSIQGMLEKVIGRGKVIAQVTAAIDFKQVEKTEEIFDPNVTAVRSEQISKEKSRGQRGSGSTGSETAAGVPGVGSNLPGVGAIGQKTSSSDSSQRQNETINYEINKVTRHVIEPVGNLTRLSVAVLLDGNYTMADGQDQPQYEPRSAAEIEKLTTLVKGVVGFDQSRGDQVIVENIPFKTDLEASWFGDEDKGALISPMMIVILRYVMITLFGGLFVIFFVKPLMAWLTREPSGHVYPATLAEVEAALEGGAASQLGTGRHGAMKADIQRLLQDNPDMASTLVRDWLNDVR
ncbi:MAG: flagellar basal-body MS-ring/collar protein FliF, partial [bacterium]|nr:flagellar basal-body MS-ring/collar protein FliF [bacterium]